MQNIVEEDTFKILLATDIHLGYGENIASRDEDTFRTFGEVLNIASKENVDFILLGGDLFHETKPTPYCINKCIELIRKYCLGDKAVEIEVLSDPSINFRRNATVNYEDPNMNISIPIFSIHGNHDDPTGKKQISALDLLASMGLINYFGRWDDVQKVEVSPVLLKKGESHLALYGLSHIRDERLARLFLDKKVKMKVPNNVEQWFNLFVLHQNRAKNRGVKNFIPETSIPEFMNLVMWGHEHDCEIEPVSILSGRTYITQPGSTVATSLSEGEAKRKNVGVLRVHQKDFHIQPIELKTVRPFIFKTTKLDPVPTVIGLVTLPERAKKHVKRIIEEMVNEAKDFDRPHMLPLVRLMVAYHDERQIFNAIRFGQEFADRIANPEDAIKFTPADKKSKPRSAMNALKIDDEEIDDANIQRVEDLIPTYIDEKNPLKVLNLAGLNEAVKKCIDSNDSDAPTFMINNQEEFLLKKLIELHPDEADIDDCLLQLQTRRNTDEFREILNDPRRGKATNNAAANDDVVTIDDDDDDGSSGSASVTPAKPARGRGSRGGKGSRGPRGGRGKAK